MRANPDMVSHPISPQLTSPRRGAEAQLSLRMGAIHQRSHESDHFAIAGTFYINLAINRYARIVVEINVECTEAIVTAIGFVENERARTPRTGYGGLTDGTLTIIE